MDQEKNYCFISERENRESEKIVGLFQQMAKERDRNIVVSHYVHSIIGENYPTFFGNMLGEAERIFVTEPGVRNKIMTEYGISEDKITYVDPKNGKERGELLMSELEAEADEI
jgi:hypothetical protein